MIIRFEWAEITSHWARVSETATGNLAHWRSPCDSTTASYFYFLIYLGTSIVQMAGYLPAEQHSVY
jgi:hypothetical protein